MDRAHVCKKSVWSTLIKLWQMLVYRSAKDRQLIQHLVAFKNFFFRHILSHKTTLVYHFHMLQFIIYDLLIFYIFVMFSLRGFVKLKKSKNPRKTRKWVGGSSPNLDLHLFFNFAFFVCF